jgi:hypothetical protein
VSDFLKVPAGEPIPLSVLELDLDPVLETPMKAKPLRHAGVLAGLVAGPFFLVSVELNTWASLGDLHQLGWEFVGGEQVPWPCSSARGPYGWAQVATFAITAC